MNYRMIEKDGLFRVMEKPTEMIIASLPTKEEARKFLRHLNFGGGFDGFTPAFMRQKYFFSNDGKLVVRV